MVTLEFYNQLEYHSKVGMNKQQEIQGLEK